MTLGIKWATVWDRRKLFNQPNLERRRNVDMFGFADDYPTKEQENETRQEVETLDAANLRGSQLQGGGQAPALDLDIPHRYVESSTAGHGHLYIDVELTDEDYGELLDVLLRLGIIQEGFASQFKDYGGTFLRTGKKNANNV